MTDKKLSPEEQVKAEKIAAFQQEIQFSFNKLQPTVISANEALSKGDVDKFNEIYSSLSEDDKLAVAKTLHIRTNEVHARYEELLSLNEQILLDVSRCKDFVAFGELQNRAKTILMANSLKDKGYSEDEIKQMVTQKTASVPDQKIIVQ